MIIAVDFDGILCEDQFPDIGPPDYRMVSFVRELMDMGHEVVLWTSRIGAKLQDAVDWCEDRGLHFTAVNANTPSNLAQYTTDTRKVYADLYIDDKAPTFILDERNRGRNQAINNLITRIRGIIKYEQDREG